MGLRTLVGPFSADGPNAWYDEFRCNCWLKIPNSFPHTDVLLLGTKRSTSVIIETRVWVSESDQGYFDETRVVF